MLKINIRKKIFTLFMGFCFYATLGAVMLPAMPDTITIIEGEDITLRSFSPQIDDIKVSRAYSGGSNIPESSSCRIKLCGILPIKNVNVKTIPQIEVIPSGDIIGLALYTKGIAVVSTESFSSGNQICAPALKSGIKPGDIITKINGNVVSTAGELAKEVSDKDIVLTILRDGKEIPFTISPAQSSADNKYKLGLWVRDSLTGIGTLTFYNPDTTQYAALGHGLTDISTGEVYSASGGNIYGADIISVTKGKKGAPGELCGIINTSGGSIGTLISNLETGVTGALQKTEFLKEEKCVLCPRSDIKPGPAKIICCIDGNTPQKFDVEIERICPGIKCSSKDMVIRITDKALLEKTGGIVQGMSGSPIIQNGRIVGAVTHVFVNDPTRGYGIYIDKMMK